MAILLPNGKQQYFATSDGSPLVGGKVYTYEAGTTTPKNTYSNAAGTVANTNPVILDSRGEATIFWSGAYKVTVKDSLDNTIYTVDNITTASDAADIDYNGVSLSSILEDHTVYSVDSMSSLYGVDSTQWSYCFVAGYYEAGDGGGGLYSYDSSDTSTPDNSGTVIVAADNARWKLCRTGYISAKQFGAVDDGYQTDAAPEIQNAINSLSGEPLLIDGAFRINSDIVLSNDVSLLGMNTYSGVRYDGTYTSAHYKSVLALSDTASIDTTESNISNCLIVNQRYTSIGAYPPPLTAANTTAAYAAFAGNAFIIRTDATITNKNNARPEISGCTILGFEYLQDPTENGAAIFKSCLIDCENGSFNGQNGLVAHGTIFDSCLLDFALNKVGPLGSFTAVTPTGYGVKTEGLANISKTIILRHDKALKTEASVGARAFISDSVLSGTYGVDAGTDSYIYSTNSSLGNVISSAAEFSVAGGAVENIENAAGRLLITGATKGTVTGAASANVEHYYPLEAHTPTTFTPVLKFGGASVGITYSIQLGSYVKMDNFVFGTIHILLTSKGSSTGDASITLPFTQTAVLGCYGSGNVIRHSDLNTLAGPIAGFITTSSAEMKLSINDYSVTPTTTAFMTDAKFQDDTLLIINFSMMIDR